VLKKILKAKNIIIPSSRKKANTDGSQKTDVSAVPEVIIG